MIDLREGPDVAKKKGTRPAEWARQPLIMTLRGSAEFKAWLHALAQYDRMSVAGLVERALVRYAKEVRFDREAPKR